MAQVNQDAPLNQPILTKSEIEELISACYSLDAEMPMRGWEPCMRLVKRLEAMLPTAPESTPHP